MGINGVTLPPDPIQDQPTYDAALAAFQAQPQVKVMFDNGAGGAPGVPYPGFERDFSRFPIPGTRARSWFFGPNGTLTGKAPKKGGSQSFNWDKSARPEHDFAGTNTGGGDLWTDHPSFDWRQPPAGTAASYLTPPLGADTAIIGAGAVQAWIKASVPDVDLQVTVSEVRPDGKETYVQSGYLRTSLRALDKKKSSLLEPVLSLRRDTEAKLPKGQFSEGRHPPLLRGPHVPRWLAHPRHRQLAERRPAGLVVCRDGAAGHRPGEDRLQQESSVASDPAGHPGSHGADAAAPVPSAARRALPELRAVDVRKVRRFALGSPRRCFGSCASPPD